MNIIKQLGKCIKCQWHQKFGGHCVVHKLSNNCHRHQHQQRELINAEIRWIINDKWRTDTEVKVNMMAKKMRNMRVSICQQMRKK